MLLSGWVIAGSHCARSYLENNASLIRPGQKCFMNSLCLKKSQAKMAVREETEKKALWGKSRPYEVNFLWASLLCIKTDVSPQSWHLPEMLIFKVISLV